MCERFLKHWETRARSCERIDWYCAAVMKVAPEEGGAGDDDYDDGDDGDEDDDVDDVEGGWGDDDGPEGERLSRSVAP